MRIIETFEELVPFVKQVKDWAIQIAIAYIRLSTREQADEGHSFHAQKDSLCRYGDELQIQNMFFFVDQETEKNTGRTEFMEMVNFFQKYGTPGNCPFLLVERTDRLVRNKQDDTIINELVIKRGLYVHYINEGHIKSAHSKSSYGLTRSIRVIVEEFYIESLAKETAKGMKAKAEQGIYPSCAPIGYLNSIGHAGQKMLICDPARAPLIKIIFELYVCGNKSISDILLIMRKHGLNSPHGKSLVSRSTIERVLHRPLYAGYFYWNGIRYNGSHDPLVSVEVFNRAQLLLGQKAPYRGASKGCSENRETGN